MHILQTTYPISLNLVSKVVYKEGIKYVKFDAIGPVVIEIWGVENGDLAVPVNSTLVCCSSFSATDTWLCILICLAKSLILVGKWPMANCYFKLYLCMYTAVYLCIPVYTVNTGVYSSAWRYQNLFIGISNNHNIPVYSAKYTATLWKD